MATKFQTISEQQKEAFAAIPQNANNWTAFLITASRNHKYRFEDQISIFAQRPDATACATLEFWNKKLNRWINRGAKGIALMDHAQGTARLSYIFDISDTHGRALSLWTAKEDYQAEIAESLQNSFGEVDATDFVSVLKETARNAVEDNYSDYFYELLVEELASEPERDMFKALVTESVAYMLLTRCGFNADEHTDANILGTISVFSYSEAFSRIGSATSDIAESVLRDIEATVRECQKYEKQPRHTFAKISEWVQNISGRNRNLNTPPERSEDYGTDNLHDEGERSAVSRPDTSGGADRAGRTGDEAQGLHTEPPQGQIRASGDRGQDERISGGGRAESDGDAGGTDLADGTAAGRDRAAQGAGSNVLDSENEQHQERSNGDSQQRNNIQLTLDGTGGVELPVLSMPKGFAPLNISQQIIDEVLCLGSGRINSTLNIAAKYRRQLTPEENVEFLKREYRRGARGFFFEGQKVSVWWDQNGMKIAVGDTAANSINPTVITWEQAEKRIGELLALGRYMPGEDLLRVEEHEVNQLAELMCYIYRDDIHKTPEEWNAPRGGFAEDVKLIAADLRDSSKLDGIISRLEADLAVAEAEPNHRRWHDTRQFVRDLKDFQREPRSYTAAEMTSAPIEYFITQDEIDGVLTRGSGIESGKLTIYDFFEREKDSKARIDFLKYHYGTGGGTHAIFGADNSYEDHDGKGLSLSRGSIGAPHAKVLLKWNKVAERIDYLIANDRYLTEEDKQNLPKYRARMEELRQAREEERIVRELEQSKPKPSKSDAIYDLHLGTTVYIGSTEYSIETLEDDHVILCPDNAPLFSEEFPRELFDVMLRENPLNDRLITGYKEPASLPVEAADETAEVEESSIVFDDVPESLPGESPAVEIGTELTIDGRRFAVDSVSGDTASLRDITFENETGFPIFRSEPVENVLKHIQAPEEKIKLREIVIDLTPRNLDESQPEEEPDLIPQWERRAESSAAPQMSGEKHNFRITDDDLGHGGPKAKFAANIAAIRLLKQLEAENRYATPEEQETLSQYVGWGGISQAFDENNPQWSAEYEELKSLLTTEEYASARGSVLNAFYTSPTVIKAMYDALANMGFVKGNILEPSCGVGNFMGLLPDSMSGSRMYGVELDSITGRIAKQLYQKNNIAVKGFEETDYPDSFFDVAIGNVPFGDYKISDRKYDKHNFLIHDYFFGKALDQVRPGGIVAFVTSKGTLDKQNPAVRKYIAQRADLIGAIRLPNNAFQANAGTGVTSDIIFLQKRDRIVDIEPDWVFLDTDSNGITMNRYFVENPDMILGEMTTESTQYGRQEAVCKPIEGADLAEQLRDAVANINAQITDYETDIDEEKEDESIPADPSVRNFSYTVVDGKIYFRENSRMNPVELSVTAENRIKGMIGLRDCVRQLIEYQTEDYADEVIARQQAELNRLYDAFTKKYGLINDRANSSAFCADSAYCLLCSLEVLNEDRELERKADIFTKRTIRPRTVITSVDTSSEALAVSLSEKAAIDMEYMSQLTGKTADEIYSDLKGVIFLNPLHGYGRGPKYIPADEYLSGNIREKLAEAREAAETKPDDYTINVEALEQVLPKDLSASEISVRLGATWIPPEIVEHFMFSLLSTPRYMQWKMHVHYSPATAQWFIENKSFDRANFQSNSTYGTARINAYKIIEETLNLREVRVFDTVEDENGNKVSVLNKKETAIAQGKQEIIRQKFAEWIWADPTRREKLVRMYNDRFNSTRPREYDGSHLTFPGMNPEITLKPHQVNAIAHILYGGNTLLAHTVGAGKTFEMVAAAMESKRLGLCHKSMFVVPNHLTEQIAAEFLQLYPSANILVATKKDFEKRNRRKFCARIATGDYDAVIIGHSQFEKIPISLERQRAIIEQQIDEITDGIQEVKSQRGERFTIKQLEKSKRMLETKLKKLMDQSKKDDVVTFEELGVDRIFVDEAHGFKNLAAVTKMRNVAGISQTEAMKSSDLFGKCRYLDEITGGKGIVFATGTPISNSMVEMYTMQRYLQYETLRRNGLSHFDCWASTFGECVTAIELSPEGTGYRTKTRFAKFYNLPELMAMFKETADVQTADMLKLPVPVAHFHNVSVKPSEQQKEIVASLAERADKVRNGMVQPYEDNMLKITNDGRKLALDQRLVNPLLPDHPDSKVNACVQNVYDIWERTTPNRSTQLLFCDLSTPKADGSFNVYTDIRDKLIAKGIPAEQIAFIHDADTDTKKKELFSKVRKGTIRVLIGSTAKMGAGTNVQDRLIAVHHLDCPWRPADLEQRNGRIIRQHNQNAEVDVYSYVTEQTFDAYLYQLVENKQKFIGQVMTSKSPARSAEDVDEQALSYAEIKALAAGNPLIKEKMDLDIAVSRLQLLKASHLSQKYALEDRILKEFPQTIARLEQRIEGYTADIATAAANPSSKEYFPPMTIKGITYEDKAGAGNAIIEACKAMTKPEAINIGKYRGFDLELSFDSFSKIYLLYLVGDLRHRVELGTDIHGNLTRIENAIEAFGERKTACESQLETAKNQLEQAKKEVDKPFPQEDELAEKQARLAELNAALNMDKRDDTIIDGEPEETENAAPNRNGEAR